MTFPSNSTINEALHDIVNIANSAITLASDRSQDLGINPAATFVVLKIIIDKNIKKSFDTLEDRMIIDTVEETFRNVKMRES